MNKFLITVFTLLVTSLLTAILVFWLISSGTILAGPTSGVPNPSGSSLESEKIVSELEASIPDSGIPLTDLPLGDSQKSALETVGVDVDTFVITPGMISCTEEKLGAIRMSEIIAGSAPTVIETAKLFPCTSAE
ncbi:MAG: hypothetical protein LR008_01845 [Candidatus Pacebacteria bacterium]|nr:hypothetical protein [Candidatus Paceibacterota bacterium]